MPSGRFPPSDLGISTRRTGGTRYAPPLCRRPCRSTKRSCSPSAYISHVTPSTPAATSLLREWNASISAGTVMWWRSATKRSFGFLFVACRIRSASCDMISRFCARLMLRLSEFPLAPALGSTGSAERCRPLFACFTATMAESDFSRLFVIGFGTFLLPLRPRATARRPRDLPGPDEVLLNVPWFLDPGMPHFASPMRLVGVAFTKLH